MEINELQLLISDFDKLKGRMATERKLTLKSIADYLKQYEVSGHESMDTAKRPDKVVTVDAGTKTVQVTRLGIPIQKQIVHLAAAFLLGNPVRLQATPADDKEKEMLMVINRTWEKNKLDYESKKIAKILMSETEVAELWYRDDPDEAYWAGTANEKRPHRLRMKVLANSLGDNLYPVFNNMGDMIAFGREYTIKVDGKDESHFDIYTDKITYLSTKTSSAWVTTEETNWFGKIPVVYYSQKAPEWNDVQSLIDRFEKTLSNHSDTNDYFASPMVKVTGEVKGFATKGESGKVLELENGADASYMSWDQSPKSQELEFKNLRSLIFDMTSTPDISFENMKGLGAISGVSRKMMFLAAHLKAADKEEEFGQCIQRRINLIKAAMLVINNQLGGASLVITPRFEFFLPKDEEGLINMLSTAVGGKAVMTQETAVRNNPYVTDPESEIEKLKEETTIDVITPDPTNTF